MRATAARRRVPRRRRPETDRRRPIGEGRSSSSTGATRSGSARSRRLSSPSATAGTAPRPQSPSSTAYVAQARACSRPSLLPSARLHSPSTAPPPFSASSQAHSDRLSSSPLPTFDTCDARALQCNVDCNLLHLICPTCLASRKGFCTEACESAPRRRPLDLLASTDPVSGKLNFEAAIAATQGPPPGQADPNKLVNVKPANIPRKEWDASRDGSKLDRSA
jgi:hypothetical protein